MLYTFKEKSKNLRAGDFYLTKHSNLSEVHVVFHLVADDSIKQSDISSRHPVILSIRNIIKLCFRYDINTLTIPLLLFNEMTEVSFHIQEFFLLSILKHDGNNCGSLDIFAIFMMNKDLQEDHHNREDLETFYFEEQPI